MPLSPPAEREVFHDRQIACRGYRRADGMFDIEGHLVDTKSYEFRNAHRGTIPPGEPLHEMGLRLTVDAELVVHAVEAATDHGPFRVCAEITPAFRRLEGLKIGPGFRRAVLERLGGVLGCTHLTELLVPMATVAVQTVFSERARVAPGEPGEPRDPHAKPRVLDTCHALRADGPVVKELFPEWYRGG